MKIHFSLFFSLLFISLYATQDVTPDLYQATAQSWVEASLLHPITAECFISPTDLQLITNLAYFSYRRSLSTLEAQDIALRALQATWHGWQNIAQTRLNPSSKTPYQTCLKKHKNLFQDFLYAQAMHRQIGLQYALIAEYVVNEDALQTKASARAVKELRARAREHVAKAFLDAKKVLGDLFNIANDYMAHKDFFLEDDTDDEQILMSRFDLWQTIWSCIPTGTLKALIDAEKLNTQACEEIWRVLTSVNQVNRQIWEAIEQARASYYLAHYHALYDLMSTHCPEKLFLIIDDEGEINPSHTTALPDLRKKS